MKPISLCLVQMGAKGLELVKVYPDVLHEETLNQIVLKSMPMGAKEGDFTSNSIGDSAFSGYIFSIPSKVGRSNIASLVAVYNDMKYDSEDIKKVFSYTVTELHKRNLDDVETITRIIPNLYKGIAEGHLKIKISSVVTLEFNFKEEKLTDKNGESISGFTEDLWK